MSVVIDKPILGGSIMKGFCYNSCILLIDISFGMLVSILTTQLCLGKHSDRTLSLTNLVFAARFLSRNIM